MREEIYTALSISGIVVTLIMTSTGGALYRQNHGDIARTIHAVGKAEMKKIKSSPGNVHIPEGRSEYHDNTNISNEQHERVRLRRGERTKFCPASCAL